MVTNVLSRGIALTALCVCCFTGCGGGDDGDYHVSGNVTFDGKPVPAGKIYFQPDGAKGNEGPTGFANIENGEFDTSAAGGKATVAGPAIVRITGWDPSGSAANSEQDGGEVVHKILFAEFQTGAELTESGSDNDFTVPMEAASRKEEGERQMVVP